VRLGPENPGRVSTTVSYCFIVIIGLNEIIRVDISPDFAGEYARVALPLKDPTAAESCIDFAAIGPALAFDEI
jgi:hypothetical protein